MIDNWHLTMKGSHMILRCSGWGNTKDILFANKKRFVWYKILRRKNHSTVLYTNCIENSRW